MKIFHAICLGIVTIAVAFLAWRAGTFFGSLDSQVNLIRSDVHSLVLPSQKAIGDFSAASLVLAQIGANERNAFSEQEGYYRDLTKRTNALLGDADATILNFNAVVIPKAGAVLDRAGGSFIHLDDSVDSLARSGTEVMTSLAPGIENLNRASAAAATAMSDPAIHETLTHVDGTSGNLDATTADIRGFVHRETTPIRGTWNLIKAFLMEFAGPAAQVATAAK